METQEVADFLMQNAYAADALHGDFLKRKEIR
jgi:hypothetical protein